MPQDAFTLQFIAKELDHALCGGKVSRITQPSKDELIFLIYTRKGTVKLSVDLSAKFCRVSLGESYEKEPPAVAPNFCMLLRKHLSNAEILKVAQQGFERVLTIYFKCFSEFESVDMQLYIEVMGKYSNAVLVKDGVIVGALKSTSLESAKRVTLTGAKYTLPEKQDKVDPTDLAALERAFENKCGGAEKFIAEKVAGIAYSTAADIVNLFGEDVTAGDLHGYICDESCSPCVTENDFKARHMRGATPFESILAAQAEYYSRAVMLRDMQDKKRRLLSAVGSALKKAEKRLLQIDEKLEECAKADEIKLKGELITANIYAVKRGEKSFEAVNYYDEAGGKILIELDERLTPSQNAQRYFKKYAKLKRTAENLSAQRSEALVKLNYLKSIEASIGFAEADEDLAGIESELIALKLWAPPPQKKGAKKKDEPSFRTYYFDGFKIVCGRNNVQNDRLTRSLSENDLWLHVKTYHSAHVGIVTKGIKPTDGAIKLAAEVCAYYSEARGRDKVTVDYTLKKNVSKPKGGAVGFVEYVEYNSIIVAPNAHTKELENE